MLVIRVAETCMVVYTDILSSVVCYVWNENTSDLSTSCLTGLLLVHLPIAHTYLILLSLSLQQFGSLPVSLMLPTVPQICTNVRKEVELFS